MGNPLIVITQATKANLEQLKLHPRETYGDVIDRLIKTTAETSQPEQAQ